MIPFFSAFVSIGAAMSGLYILLDHLKSFAVLIYTCRAAPCRCLTVVNNARDRVQNQLKNLLTWSRLDRKGEDSKMGAEYKSRTQKKKEDRALQRLGEQLISLPVRQLEAMDLPDELLTAIELARKIKSRSARRRQIQYIGALMRHIDPQPIIVALERIRPGNTRK
jgi:ribosomal 50S subunit-associated protein YjgA (DUF615 family)